MRTRARTPRAVGITLLTLVSLLVAASTALGANFSPLQNADMMVGSSDWTYESYGNGDAMTTGFNGPTGVSVDGSGSVYVADTFNHRSMHWSDPPDADNEAFDHVLMKGSPAFPDPTRSWFKTYSNGTSHPESITVSGDGVTLKGLANNRYHNVVVAFTGEPAAHSHTDSMGTSRVTIGGGPSEWSLNRLRAPSGEWTNGTRVAIADTEHHRVLLWDSWPTSDAEPATTVLGQAGASSALDICPNRAVNTVPNPDQCFSAGSPESFAATNINTMMRPKGVHYDAANDLLFVADSVNNRILVWDGWPTAGNHGVDADWVIGQPDFTSYSSGHCPTNGDRRLNYPVSVTGTTTGGGRLAITAKGNHRVVVLDGYTGGTQPTFSSVLGQTNFASCSPNRGTGTGTATARSLRDPGQIAFDASGNLWVADTTNNRVLAFNSTATDTDAFRVLGQPDKTTSSMLGYSGNKAIIRRTSDSNDDGIRVAFGTDGTVIASDRDQGILSIWNDEPSTIDEDLDVRWGQRLRSDTGGNGPGNVRTTTTTSDPKGIWTDGTRTALADNANNRILLWTSTITSDQQPADIIFNSDNGRSASINNLDSPYDVTSDGTDLYVADRSNDRVLVWRDAFNQASDATPDVVIGTGTPGSGITQLNAPSGVSIYQDQLVVADKGNNRIAIFNDASTIVTNAPPRDALVTHQTSGIDDVSLGGGAVFWNAGHYAYVMDPAPHSGTASSGALPIGDGNSYRPAQNALFGPAGIAAANGRVWIANGEHARLMRWTDTTAPTITVVPSATVRCDGTVTVTWSTSESTTSEVYWDVTTRAPGAYSTYVGGSEIDPLYTGLTHTIELSYATPGIKYAVVRSVDWNGHAVESNEFSFEVPATCPAPTTMLADDTDAQAGSARPNPAPGPNAPPIRVVDFHSSWLQSSGVAMDAFQTQTWTTPPEHAGGLWRFDNNLTADTHSTATGTGSWNGSSSFNASGKFGQAINVDTTRGVRIPHSTALEKGNDFTVDAWFRTSNPFASGNAWAIVFEKVDTVCNDTYACNYGVQFVQGTNELCAEMTTVSGTWIQTCGPATGLNDNEWHHVAMTMSSTNRLRLYVDGELHSPQLNVGAQAHLTSGDVWFGRNGIGNDTFTGTIDEFRFTPTAYSAEAIRGYYNTGRPHATQLWNVGTTPLDATCDTGTRCSDQVYAGVDELLRTGARYWQRTRFNTVNNDYWSAWGVDWFETLPEAWLAINAGGSVNIDAAPGETHFATSNVQVSSNGATGYQLFATDDHVGHDDWGLADGSEFIPDRQGSATAPAAWPTNEYGYGVTVRSATGGRMAKWKDTAGDGVIGVWPENDVTNNWYSSLSESQDLLLHERASYGSATDDILVTWRASVPLDQPAGTYTGTMYLTAVASP